MQNVDSAITVRAKHSLFGIKLTSTNNKENPNALTIPAGNRTVETMAKIYKGIPAGNMGELLGSPFTAHFVGGCVIGSDVRSGVIDKYHRIWNYPTLHVVDGSSITANLGVNPSLTITAQAERAFSYWPTKNELDSRTPQEKL